MMAMPGLLQEVAGLLEVMMLIGRASKKRSEFVGLSSFLLFLVLYAKGEKIRGVNNFSTPWRGCCNRSFHVPSIESSPLRVVFARLRV